MKNVIFIVLIATSAAAQLTHSVRVKLTGTCPYLPAASLQLVLNGNETVPATLEPADATRRVWTGDWTDPNDPTRRFQAKGSTASVRLGGARTDCRISVADSKHDRIEAVFTFDCDERPASDVRVETDPDQKFSYVRFLRRTNKTELDCDCLEFATPPGVRVVPDVRLKTEVLNLQLGLDEPDRDVLWLHVNDLITPTSALAQLNHDDVVQAIVFSTPGEGFSSNAHDVHRVIPKLSRLKHLTLTKVK